jgi:hypothetical protein
MSTATLIKSALLVLWIHGTASAQAVDGTVLLEEKVQRIIFPIVQFKDATIEQAVEYIRVKSRDLDTITQPPATAGVSIVLRDGALTDTISLDLRDAPLIEVVRYCAERVGLQYRVEKHAVVLAVKFEEKPAPPAATPPPVLGNADQIIFPTVQFRDATLAEAADVKAGKVTARGERLVWKWQAAQVPDFAVALSNHYRWDAASTVVDSVPVLGLNCSLVDETSSPVSVPVVASVKVM